VSLVDLGLDGSGFVRKSKAGKAHHTLEEMLAARQAKGTPPVWTTLRSILQRQTRTTRVFPYRVRSICTQPHNPIPSPGRSMTPWI